ncbi:MAG: glycosyltransferase family 4 protein [Gemmataceae bacterium]|nr:glycosyltransferase family 4 protein [Gemmataceae bacterium]
MPEMPVVLDARVVTGTGGGPDKTILNSPRLLARGGYRMLCAYMHPPGDPGFDHIRRKANGVQAPLLSVPDRGPWDWKVVSRLHRICKQQQVRIWHGHDYKSNLLGLVLSWFWPMRLVTTVHGWVKHTWRTPLYYAIDRLCLPRFEKVICVSADLHDSCLASGVAADRCLLIENGIDTTEYARTQGRADARQRLNIPAQRLVIGAVGRLSPEKGFDILIRATHQLLNRGMDVELHVIGEGDDEARLRRLIQELGIEERCRLQGFHSELRPFYEAMDVFVLSSLREGLPNVVLEAMAMEVPVIATAVAGVPRLIQDGCNGVLIPPRECEPLLEALARLLDDPQCREALSKAGRQTVETRYSFDQRTRRLQQVYDQLLRT